MSLTTDWAELQAAFTEYADDPSDAGGGTTLVLSLPVSGSTARASTAVAANLLRGLVNDYFDTYETPILAQWASISNTGPTQGPHGYSLALYLKARSPRLFTAHADAIRTAVEQALEDLPKNLDHPDGETQSVMDALMRAQVLRDEYADA